LKGKLDLGLHPVDDLFEIDESREDKKRERLLDIPVPIFPTFRITHIRSGTMKVWRNWLKVSKRVG